jgi:hypothetical protein
MTGWATLVAAPASAQDGIFGGLQAGVESVFSSVTSKITFASGAETKTATTTIYPTFTLNMNTLLYPSLRLSAGGVFEINKLSSRIGPITTDSTLTSSRPFFLLRSTNPVLSPGIGFFRRVGRDRTAGLSDIKLVNDEYDAYLGWNPDGGPRSEFQFIRTNTFDGERVYQDVTKDFASLVSSYNYRNLGLHYRGASLDTDDRIGRLQTRQVSHAGRVDYSQSFIQKRLLWNASYNANRQILTTLAQGAEGEVALPVTPFAGLSAISDVPVTAKLSPNGQLIDGNLTAGAGINLGLPPTPADAQLRNMGLDLLTPTEVNRFLIWVDRELPVDIANAFSWEIYSSPDNVIWKRESSVPVAPFGTFENRFEIDFPGVNARYIKVVTRPLSATVPDSARFQDILVTELQAFLRRPASEVSGKLTQDSSLLNTDVRLRLLDSPGLYYEGFYLSNMNSSGRDTDTLSNGLSMNQAFGRIFSAYARFAREQGEQVEGHRVANVTNATFTIDPASTFQSSFLYTGLDEEVAGLPNTRRGFFVQNSARPYRGVDVLFGIGWTSTAQETGEISHDRLVNVSATIVPREHVSLTLSYDGRETNRSGTFVGDPRSMEHRSYVSLAIDPIRTLHLVLGGEVIALTGKDTRTTLNIGTSWAPFPDGTLQFIFAYNEAVRALEFGKDRNTLGAVRWNVSRKSYVDVSFQRTRNANVSQTTESRILTARVRFFL